MKLSEIKNLLADKIQTYSTTIIKVEGEDKFEYEYELHPSHCKRPELNLLNAIFCNDPIYNELKDLEVKYIYCGDKGFVVDVDVKDAYELFEKIANENKIPLIIKKYVVVE